ncbi:hypothetical protein FKM82_027726 [Ascaphus truei]
MCLGQWFHGFLLLNPFTVGGTSNPLLCNLFQVTPVSREIHFLYFTHLNPILKLIKYFVVVTVTMMLNKTLCCSLEGCKVIF